jgi:hypothetical protein
MEFVGTNQYLPPRQEGPIKGYQRKKSTTLKLMTSGLHPYHIDATMDQYEATMYFWGLAEITYEVTQISHLHLIQRFSSIKWWHVALKRLNRGKHPHWAQRAPSPKHQVKFPRFESNCNNLILHSFQRSRGNLRTCVVLEFIFTTILYHLASKITSISNPNKSHSSKKHLVVDEPLID